MRFTGGSYTLALHFSEPVFEAAGARAFSVFANNLEIIADLDIYAETGAIPLNKGPPTSWRSVVFA